MRFLADMGVALPVIQCLRAAGHEAIHLREEGLQKLPDEEIFLKAASERRILITFDLDFGEILALSGNQSISVLLFRFHNTRTPHVIARLEKVLEESGSALEQGAIIVVEDFRHRVRRLPLGG
jgi:predicted nuclease of predicted toxin-antitoxin system